MAERSDAVLWCLYHASMLGDFPNDMEELAGLMGEAKRMMEAERNDEEARMAHEATLESLKNEALNRIDALEQHVSYLISYCGIDGEFEGNISGVMERLRGDIEEGDTDKMVLAASNVPTALRFAVSRRLGRISGGAPPELV